MTIRRVGGKGGDTDTLECGAADHPAYGSGPEWQGQGPRVALLTPYTGGNLGDAAIQDAMIANIRLRLPDAQFSGISLNCDNFVERHGAGAFPLYGMDRAFSRKSRGRSVEQPEERGSSAGELGQKSRGVRASQIKTALKSIPGLGPCLQWAHACVVALSREIGHSVEGYRFLCTQDLVIVSGGGQLDDEWGGPWRHPFALFKWAVLAGIARVPYAVASVGASRKTSTASRILLSAALRMARYRSYRDRNSREIAAGLLQRAAGDSVVPDLAFSLPASELPPPAGIRSIAQGRTVVAVSAIAFAKPGSWPYQDSALYGHYLQQMARVVGQLLERGYFVVMIWSSRMDESVIAELLACLDPESKKRVGRQVYVPAITTWKDIVALLLDVDFLIASRLHSTILSFVSQKPTIAISFDPKVDWVMEDLGQTDYLLQIRDFAAEDVIEALERIELHRDSITGEIGSYRRRIPSVSASQYDTLAELAMASHRHKRT